jgi:hypothetical protein
MNPPILDKELVISMNYPILPLTTYCGSSFRGCQEMRHKNGKNGRIGDFFKGRACVSKFSFFFNG